MASDPIIAAILQAPSSIVHTLKIVYAERLETPYPPIKFHVIELGEDRKLWEDHLKNAPLSDSRTNNHKRFLVMALDPSKFEYTVAKGDCVIFFEIIEGGENQVIGLVVQNLIGDKATADAPNGSVFDHINKANRMRVSTTCQEIERILRDMYKLRIREEWHLLATPLALVV